MPYRRRRYRGRRKKMGMWGYMNRAQKVATMAYKAYRGVRFIKGIVNSEKQRADATHSSNPTTTGVVSSCSAIAQGDAEGTRTGLSILAKYVYVKGTWTIHASATNTLVRIDIVMDTECDGTLPSQATIYNAVGVNGMVQTDEGTRFKILASRRYALSDTGVKSLAFNLFVPINKHIKYNGSAGTDERENQILIVVTSSEATNTPSFAAVSRLVYYDN